MNMEGRLRLFNSITKTLEVFVPEKENHVRIYICGPTVYDSPHIGHARTYVMFDVVRRILTDYFGYNVTLVMNITDIDDKIIARANELKGSSASIGDELGDKLRISTRSIEEDVVYEADKLKKHVDFLTKRYTDEFFEDMRILNVREPTFITRVSDYVERIVGFIEKLEENGLAYESGGSVYFDVERYRRYHDYPIFKSREGINEEAEPSRDKKNAADFALWKKAKENEPTYDSRWGKGRPGWHIECSVMASDILGDSVDIHAGGIDLAFPHHENEIAQCQGYFAKEPWVRYFLHTGHLNIDGLKMSKSLKNFTTIKDMLKLATPRQLRILFLHHHWNKDMNYEVEQLKFAENAERKMFNFLSVADSLGKSGAPFRTLGSEDAEVMGELERTQGEIHLALLDNLDTATVLKKVLELISFTNIRLKACSTSAVLMVRDYVKRMIGILGLSEEKAVEMNAEPIAELLNSFRSQIRQLAKKKEGYQEFFKACDTVREGIKEFGFVIEDDGVRSSIRRAGS
jgi:cysteinyl-tRNA synthetase